MSDLPTDPHPAKAATIAAYDASAAAYRDGTIAVPPVVAAALRRLADATRRGGALHASLEEGEGEGWSAHGNVSVPRLFVYWREVPLLRALDQAGWRVEQVERYDGVRGDRWLQVMATRKDA